MNLKQMNARGETDLDSKNLLQDYLETERQKVGKEEYSVLVDSSQWNGGPS